MRSGWSLKFSSCKGAKAQRKNITMDENELSKIVLDVAFDIHKKLGPGLLESVYEAVMAYELSHTFGRCTKTKTDPGNLERF
jgi:hypothetical protein